MVVSVARGKVITAKASVQLQCRALPWDEHQDCEARQAWKHLFARLPTASAFHHPEWTALECRTGAVTPWRVLVISRGKEPLAVIPLRKRTPWTAEIIEDFCPDTPPLLIDPAAEEDVWTCLVDWIREKRSIGAVILGRCTDRQRLTLFREIVRSRGAAWRLDPVMPTIAIPLPASWEDYLSGLGSRTRAEIRRLERQLTRDFPDAELEILTDYRTIDTAVDELIALHRRRWRHQLCGSIFDLPVKADYYRQAFRWAVQQGWAAIAVLRIGGKTLATGTIFHIPGQKNLDCHYLACDRDANLPKRLSPGILLFSHIARWAIARGVQSMCMGFGKSDYKMQLGGQALERWEMTLARSSFDLALSRGATAFCHYLNRIPQYARYVLRRITRGEEQPQEKTGAAQSVSTADRPPSPVG